MPHPSTLRKAKNRRQVYSKGAISSKPPKEFDKKRVSGGVSPLQILHSDPVPNEFFNKVIWKPSSNSFYNMIDFQVMMETYGKEYTKNLIYTLIEDTYGNWYYEIKGVLQDMKLFLKSSTSSGISFKI